MAAAAAAGIQSNIVENQRQSIIRRPGCTGTQIRLSSKQTSTIMCCLDYQISNKLIPDLPGEWSKYTHPAISFCNLILYTSDGLTGRSRARKSKVIKHSITLKRLAADFEVLKNEMQDLKKELVSSQSLPNKRCPKKRVTFQDNVS